MILVGDTADSMSSEGSTMSAASPIWCLASRDNLIITGCGDGRIEVHTIGLGYPGVHICDYYTDYIIL